MREHWKHVLLYSLMFTAIVATIFCPYVQAHEQDDPHTHLYGKKLTPLLAYVIWCEDSTVYVTVDTWTDGIHTMWVFSGPCPEG